MKSPTFLHSDQPAQPQRRTGFTPILAVLMASVLWVFPVGDAQADQNHTQLAWQENNRFSDLEREVLQRFLDHFLPEEDDGARQRQGRPGRTGPPDHAGPPGNVGPPGHAGGLPPGIARNLERGKPLPPGLAKRTPPADIQQSLPSRDDYEIVIVDRDAYLVSVATQVIVDILRGR